MIFDIFCIKLKFFETEFSWPIWGRVLPLWVTETLYGKILIFQKQHEIAYKLTKTASDWSRDGYSVLGFSGTEPWGFMKSWGSQV